MRRTYLIDGYNLIHALGMIQKHIGPGDLEIARRQLLDFLITIFGSDGPCITVVFDAKQSPPGIARQQEYQGLHIDFAPKAQSADDRIEDLIEASAEPHALVVISNDARLQAAAERRGASPWTHEALLDFLEEKGKPAPRANAEPERLCEVNEEERKRWLEEFGSIEKDPDLKEFFDQDRFE
jgi:uncharacterized protein